MDFHALAATRYSCRAYRPDEVPEDRLERVLAAALLAPTACNRQPFRIIVVRTAGKAEALAKVYHRPWFAQAPLVLAVVGLPEEGWRRSDGTSYTAVDCAIVMDHLILAATQEGLGTCWIGAFDTQAARSFLGLPPGAEPVAFTPLGFAADEPGPKRRRRLDDLVRRERW